MEAINLTIHGFCRQSNYNRSWPASKSHRFEIFMHPEIVLLTRVGYNLSVVSCYLGVTRMPGKCFLERVGPSALETGRGYDD